MIISYNYYHPILDDFCHHFFDDYTMQLLSSSTSASLLSFQTFRWYIGHRLMYTDFASRQVAQEQDTCWKYSSSHPTLTPGILILRCTAHMAFVVGLKLCFHTNLHRIPLKYQISISTKQHYLRQQLQATPVHLELIDTTL